MGTNYYVLGCRHPLPSPKPSKIKIKDSLTDLSIPRPFMAFGWKERPQQSNFLIKMQRSGPVKIQVFWRRLTLPFLQVKSKLGKNLNQCRLHCNRRKWQNTSLLGIIDEHSHIAISGGVNECNPIQYCRGENWRRCKFWMTSTFTVCFLVVTSSQLLHGSCNPISGQSAN